MTVTIGHNCFFYLFLYLLLFATLFLHQTLSYARINVGSAVRSLHHNLRYAQKKFAFPSVQWLENLKAITKQLNTSHCLDQASIKAKPSKQRDPRLPLLHRRNVAAFNYICGKYPLQGFRPHSCLFDRSRAGDSRGPFITCH